MQLGIKNIFFSRNFFLRTNKETSDKSGISGLSHHDLLKLPEIWMGRVGGQAEDDSLTRRLTFILTSHSYRYGSLKS